MAVNQVVASSFHQSVICDSPAVPNSGDPCRWGNMTGVALNDEAADGTTVLDFSPATWDLLCLANNGGPSQINPGDTIFFADGAPPVLSKITTGYLFGVAMGTVPAGTSAVIPVLKLVTPSAAGVFGAGSVTAVEIAAGAVGTSELAAGAVGFDALTATLAIGVVNLPVTQARELAAGDIPAAAAVGGLLAKDTTPILEMATNNLRVAWAAANVDPILLPPFAYPPDLDDTKNVLVKLLISKDANADAGAVVGVDYREGIADADAGGNTAALAGAALAEYSVTILAADIGAHPKVANIVITPGVHANDAIYLHSAWVEYTRK